MNNMMAMMQRFNQFRQQYAGQNPDTVIQQMMQNGRISQSQLDQARQMAEQFKQMMGPGAQGFNHIS